MRDLDELFEALQTSDFRSGLSLGPKERAYLAAKTLPVILDHARGFISERLAPARPVNDGRQTPRRGHPVFVAQHAIGACCRNCLHKWHRIPPGRALTDEEIAYLVRVIERWLRQALATQG